MQPHFLSVRQLLEADQPTQALEVLRSNAPTTENEARVQEYLFACAHVRLQDWSAARSALRYLLPPSLQVVEEEDQYSPHEHEALSLLRLGSAATSLEELTEASGHLAACLKVLSAHRVQRHAFLSFEARMVYGRVLLARHLSNSALQVLQVAARSVNAATHGDIHELLAQAYQQLGDHTHMKEEIQQALVLFTEAGNLPKRVGLYLYQADNDTTVEGKGCIALYEQAIALADAYKDSLLRVQACIAFARYLRHHSMLTEASAYCRLARAHLESSKHVELTARVLLESVRVALDLAKQSTQPEQEKNAFLKEALQHIERAELLPLVDTSSSLAAILFELKGRTLDALGRREEALAAFKTSLTFQQK